MVRDKHRDKKYFDIYISKKEELIRKNLDKYEKGLLKEDRISSVLNFTISRYKKIFEAKYSRGDNMFSAEVYKDYLNYLKLVFDSWEENIGKYRFVEGKKTIVLNQYTFSMYLNIIDRISFGILLDFENKDFQLLIDYVERDCVKDYLLEFLIRYYDKERPLIHNESYQKFFHINERLGRLKTIIKETNNAIAEQELKFFLENEWYASFKDTPLFNQHLNPHKTYAGYWCFVAAAIVKIKDLDDSSFRDNVYYPKDMLR